ncbi:MAG: tail fiber domain-containing protein [Endomicrobiia bacterium]
MKGGLIVLGDYNDTEMLNINIAYKTAIAVDLTNRVFYSRLGESSGKKLLGGVKFPVSGGGDGLAVWKITSSSSYTTAIIDYVDVVIDSSSVNFNNRELNNITTINATTANITNLGDNLNANNKNITNVNTLDAITINATSYSGYSFGLTSRQNNIELVGLDNTALKLSSIRIDTSGATADYVLKVNSVNSGVVSFVTVPLSTLPTGNAVQWNGVELDKTSWANGNLLVVSSSNQVKSTNSVSSINTSQSIGNYNERFGYQALCSNITGSCNSAFGYQALYSNTHYLNMIGSFNSAFGYQALYSNATGSCNSAFGYRAGFNWTGDRGLFLAGFTNDDSLYGASTVYIARQDATNCVDFYMKGIVGKVSGGATLYINTSTGQIGSGTSALAFKENIKDVSDISNKIYELKPVMFNYKKEFTGNEEESKKCVFGFIWEDVVEVLPEICAPKGVSDGEKYVNLDRLVPLLIAEIKKLKGEIEWLKRKLI